MSAVVISCWARAACLLPSLRISGALTKMATGGNSSDLAMYEQVRPSRRQAMHAMFSVGATHR